MKKLRFSLTVLLILIGGFGYAQELKITAFQRMDRDLMARTQERLDLNGNPCAVVRVSIPNAERVSLRETLLVMSFTSRERPLFT